MNNFFKINLLIFFKKKISLLPRREKIKKILFRKLIRKTRKR
jgi:hypothetical protein